jgi:hypothetical protein
LLWVYEKGRLPRCSVPEAEAFRNDFYSFEENGERNTEVEAWFGQLEKQVAPIIGDLKTSKREPSPQERGCLATFMGTMYTRTPLGRQLSEERFGPATLRMLKNAAADALEFRRLYESVDAGPADEQTVEQVRQDVLLGRSDALEARADFRLASVIQTGLVVARILLEMGWQFIHAPQGHLFITSDNPFVSESSVPGSRAIHFRTGVNYPNTAAWFPLTRDVCLLMKRDLISGTASTPANTARAINKRIMICAESRIYAGEDSRDLLKAFERHGCKVPMETLDLRYEGQKL